MGYGIGKLDIEIEGTTALLMHSPKAMLEPQEEVRSSKVKYDHEEEAENAAYRMKNGNLYIPSTAIMGCLMNAAAYKKAGKNALRPILAGGVRIEEEEIDLGIKDYDIDLRTVRIQRNRVVRARPKIKKWKAKFQMVYDKGLIANPQVMIGDVLEEGGKRVGILDFSPRNKGPFGTFRVTKFIEAK